MIKLLKSLILLTVLAVITASSQGVHWEAKTTKGGEKERIDRFYYMPKMMKMTEGSQGMSVILRLDKELMIMIDSQKKSYYQMTFDEMEQMMAGANAAHDAQMDAMRKQLEALPEEKREMALKMMGGQMEPPEEPEVDVENTGESKSISGYSCTKYIVKTNGERTSTVWATMDVDEFEIMKDDMMEFAERMRAMSRGRATEGPVLEEGIDGFPIQTETSGGWKTVVTKVEERSTPESEFEAPAGYQKSDMPSMSGMPEGY